jgi:hypothetical protein
MQMANFDSFIKLNMKLNEHILKGFNNNNNNLNIEKVKNILIFLEN